MAKRVYELASLLGTTNDQMIEILNSNGIEVSDYTDLVDNKLEEKIRKDVLPNYNFVSHDNKSSLKSINIIGLFNKKNYKITFKDDINLFIAENGFGKTTILNIIVAVLKGDKKKLKTLPFKKIIVNFNVESIEISKEEFYENKLSKVKTRRLLKKLEYKLPNHMFERVYDEFITNGNIDIINLRRLLKENQIEKFNHKLFSIHLSDVCPKLRPVIRTLRRLATFIENTMTYSNLTNGPLEGINNKTKLIKRVSFGYRNYDNLRNRIMIIYVIEL